MDYRLIMSGERLLDYLPFQTEIYKFASNAIGHGEFSAEELRRIVVNRGLDTVKILQSKANFSFDQSRIIEIGPGWNGLDPVLFYLLGAKEIHTFDHIRWLSPERLRASINAVELAIPEMSSELGLPEDELQGRLDSVDTRGKVDEIFEEMGVTYHNSDLNPDELEGDFDLFYSASTLQRVPEPALLPLVKDVVELLRDGGASYHIIHPRDIHEQYDEGLNQFKYLIYSDWFWELITSDKFSSQNRLRHVDFLRIFDSAGFTNIYDRIRRDSVEAINNLSLARRFSSYSQEEIVISQFQLCSVVDESGEDDQYGFVNEMETVSEAKETSEGSVDPWSDRRISG